jgi:hypothetical protein
VPVAAAIQVPLTHTLGVEKQDSLPPATSTLGARTSAGTTPAPGN